MKKLKKIFYVLLTLLLSTIVITFLWADYELTKIQGKSTEVIDIKSFVNSPQSIIIKNVNILSPDSSHFIKNRNIVIENGKIKSIAQVTTIHNSKFTIDGTNKFLIPGLVDSHVHLKESKNDLYLYLVNGVTSIREMSGKPLTLGWKKSIMENDEIGPNMYVTSPSISSVKGLKGYYHSWTRRTINYTNKQAALNAIKKIKKQGYDAIKMYGFVNPEMFKTTLDIAKDLNIPVIGHIPQINLATFYQSGQKEVAHVEELTKKIIEEYGKSLTENPQDFIKFVEIKSNQISQELKNNEIYVTSTVALMESLIPQKFDLINKLKEVKIVYVNPKIIEGTSIAKLGWLPSTNGYQEEGLDDLNYRKVIKTFWELYVDAIRIMTKSLIFNNVPIFIGTDANVTPMVPGFSLHEELITLSHYGMSNSELLKSATSRPNQWMERKSGQIKIGYNSELLLLNKNPLEDIKNTKTIEYVFFDKYMINKNQIKGILKAIENNNNKNRSVNIDEFIK